MNNQKQNEWAERLLGQTTQVLYWLTVPFKEIWYGARTHRLPWVGCLSVTLFLQLAIFFHWDVQIFIKHGLVWFYPTKIISYRIYYLILVILPFWTWGLIQAGLKRKFLDKLKTVFQEIGLKNNLGKLPQFVFDLPVDEQTRKLRLHRNHIAPKEFTEKRPALESALQIYIDELREERTKGTVDLIYSPLPMPELFEFNNDGKARVSEFQVGTTRAKVVTADFNETPHVLVAGQTGGGKSTFLRQLITSIILRQSGMRLTLIDLKGGLEFQVFEQLPGVEVLGNVPQAVSFLKGIKEQIDSRMALLKENRCKDIFQFEKEKAKAGENGRRLTRHLIVVDEAAELFLVGGSGSVEDIQEARRILSQVARQGRSLGVHLIVATQRPDSRALDPQIKANLPGILCFQMVNDTSSIAVLGTGRATDLPPIPGRAIWKTALEAVEVQTPYLSYEEAEALLKGLRFEKQSTPAKAITTANSGDLTQASRPLPGELA